jgi:hypothetical protein
VSLVSSRDIQIETAYEVELDVAKKRLSVEVGGAAVLSSDSGPLAANASTRSVVLACRVTDPVTVEVQSPGPLHVSVGAQGPAGASGTGQELVSVGGFGTASVLPGRLVYSTGADLAHAYAETLPAALALGVFTGALGKVQVSGAADVRFIDGCPAPTANASV